MFAIKVVTIINNGLNAEFLFLRSIKKINVYQGIFTGPKQFYPYKE